MSGEEQQSSGRISATALSNQLENIKVAVRLRPFTEREKQRNNRRIVDIEKNTVVLYSPKHVDVHQKKFTFDYSYWSLDGFKKDSSGVNIPDLSDPNCEKYVGQEKVFEDLGTFLLFNALEGYNSALLAYGQTGSGKSYTVSGYGQNEGILPRFARALFVELDKKARPMRGESSSKDNDNTNSDQVTNSEQIEREGQSADSGPRTSIDKDIPSNMRYEVFFSMIEIYNEVVRDLLAKNHGDMMSQSTFSRRGLKVREHPKHGFFVENLTSFACADKTEIEQRIEEGQLNKSIAATSMNETSSRGHTIYEFKIKQYKLKSAESSEEILTTSVVQLVDLAGSERMAVHVTGQLGGDSFVGGVSNSQFQRFGLDKSATIIKHTGQVKSTKVPTSASSSSSSAAQQSSLKRTATNSIANSNNTKSLYKPNQHQQRFKESVSINQSLSVLGNCIQVLSQYSQQLESGTGMCKKPNPKIPYRDSVLTKLLNRCCLSGNSKVVIIATLSPSDINYDDTLSTLRFADRAKQIRTHAIVNRMSRSEIVENIQKENERLKQIVDGRVTRSDDSSQTSNFDDSENVMENFTGSRIGNDTTTNRAATVDTMATPIRNRTGTRRTREDRQFGKKSTKENPMGLRSSSQSNPSLVKDEQMKRLVSPASRNMINTNKEDETPIRTMLKSRSTGHNLAAAAGKQYNKREGERSLESGGGGSEDEEYNDIGPSDEVDLNELGDIKEGLISPESDDSYAAFADEDMTNEEKIGIFNKMLSNNTTPANNQKNRQVETTSPVSKSKMIRPKKASRARAGVRRVSIISSTLKKSNPYLSNLNQDEQLTGMISYIIKMGSTIVGKNSDCDIVLHGPELRGQHAKISREHLIDKDSSFEKKEQPIKSEKGEESTSGSFAVYIEPTFTEPTAARVAVTGDEKALEKIVALMVNGSPVVKRTRLNHCDRLLFGTNAYFVFVDNMNAANSNSDTVANLDLVTFDMARNEVLRKVMAEAENEAMIKEIKDYTHRPGTGKHRVKSDESKQKSIADETGVARGMSGDVVRSKLRRSITIHDQESVINGKLQPTSEEDVRQADDATGVASSAKDEDTPSRDDMKSSGLESEEVGYRDQLMEDTYEYAMPVAEVNAVAKEMDIKVTYGLKIMTGEEQLIGLQGSSYTDSNVSDGFSSSSLADAGEHDSTRAKARDNLVNDDRVTRLTKFEGLDIPPALFIKIHLEEQDMDFYWSKEKFQARRFKILELYGPWDVGGKSGLVEHLIDQSKTQGDYLIDPFVDDPSSTPVLIGHAQITLRPISHLTDIKQSYDILDLNDDIVGSIRIEAIPCHADRQTTIPENGDEPDEGRVNQPYLPYNDEDLTRILLDSPRKLLNRKLVFLLKILSCHGIPSKYSHVFCQYTLNADGPMIKTKVMRDDGSMDGDSSNQVINEDNELQFDHSHFIAFERVDQDMLDFLEHGFLTIQVVGLYRQPTDTSRSPTVISTIINSINKYKYRIEQQNAYSSNNYSGSAHHSNTDSAKSNRGPSSGVKNSNSASSSVVSTSATVNLFDPQNDDDEGSSMNGLSQENVIDMILTKRKLDRAENQLHYIKRTVNIAEHYNKKHIPVKTVKKLLNSYGHELDSGSLEEMAADVTVKGRSTTNKNSACSIQ